jgi:hypothetical protein
MSYLGRDVEGTQGVVEALQEIVHLEKLGVDGGN